MNCIEFKKYMEEYIEGKVEDKLKQEMKEHMDTCPSCREEYESTKSIVEMLKMDASAANLKDRQKKDIKESILKAPVRKKRGFANTAKSLMYVAAIFMFVTVGIYFAGGININIGPGTSAVEKESVSAELTDKVDKLEGEKDILLGEIEELKDDNTELSSYIKDLEGGKAKDWMMINANLNEAIIEGAVVSVDKPSSSIVLEVYKDDNTPDIDPRVIIPDGIMITRVDEEPLEDGQYPIGQGSVDDLKPGDHITIHYLGDQKAARAILLYK